MGNRLFNCHAAALRQLPLVDRRTERKTALVESGLDRLAVLNVV